MIQFITRYLDTIGTILPEQIFRGQANSAWSLLPSLARQHHHFSNGQWIFNSWEDAESILMDQFKTYSPPFLNEQPENELEWLVLAQHYGLPTTLLDWTTNPLKALFFAVEDSHFDDSDAAVYSYLPKYWFSSIEPNIRPLSPTCFFPKHQNVRIINQEGCFLIFPLPPGYSEFPPLKHIEGQPGSETIFPRKILIPSYEKTSIRMQLDMLGINHRTVFPSLDGVSKTILRRAGIP